MYGFGFSGQVFGMCIPRVNVTITILRDFKQLATQIKGITVIECIPHKLHMYDRLDLNSLVITTYTLHNYLGLQIGQALQIIRSGFIT
jgi:hypothetical protein